MWGFTIGRLYFHPARYNKHTAVKYALPLLSPPTFAHAEVFALKLHTSDKYEILSSNPATYNPIVSLIAAKV